ncbi:hypothetical protein V2J09_011538 [Rumex salicifolius]
MEIGLAPKTVIVLALLFGVAAAFDYGDALDKSLLFFEAQRAGKLPSDQRVKWRANSALRDGFQQGYIYISPSKSSFSNPDSFYNLTRTQEDLVGGYYDAGDHVKFGLPMAFSVTMMAWAAVEFRGQIASANQMSNTLWAIRWGTDYFLKAHPYPNVLWAQVGDGNSDHYCWQRAEDMTTSRTAYKLDAGHPGSDLAGETAAALAAASIAFAPYNSSYSSVLLSHAQQLFSFANTYRGEYDDSISIARDFYSSSGYQDELLWAAAWLYRATKKEYYLTYLVQNAASMGGTGWAVKEFSWDNKYAGLQVLISKILLEGKGGKYISTLQQYRAKADFFACACMQKNNGYNVDLTPGGLIYIRQWNNLQYASSAAFLLAVYSQYLGAAKAVAKGASIASTSALRTPVGCSEGFERWYHRIQADPNVIYGALVGGPDKSDNFNDQRSNYEQTEPTISGTAPLIGLFAKLSRGYGSTTPAARYTSKPSVPAFKQPSTPHYSFTKSWSSPIKFIHSITATWTTKGVTYYRHRVLVKNTSTKTIRYLKLRLENLEGKVYGLTYANVKGIYSAPSNVKILSPGKEFSFVYIQGGPQAKFCTQ